jgi:hypothetical protein
MFCAFPKKLPVIYVQLSLFAGTKRGGRPFIRAVWGNGEEYKQSFSFNIYAFMFYLMKIILFCAADTLIFSTIKVK